MIVEHSFGWRAESEFGVGVFGRACRAGGESLNVALSVVGRDGIFGQLSSDAGLERAEAIVGMTQVHGDAVEIVGPEDHSELPEADALITSEPGVVLTGVTADCVPLILMSEGGVSVVHAGWRGLANGIIGKAVRELSEVAGPAPQQIRAFVGPSAAGCCYEVGDEVIDAIGSTASVAGQLLSSADTAIRQLEGAGVERIESVDVCTICAGQEVLNSFRRDGDSAGRQGVLAWLN